MPGYHNALLQLTYLRTLTLFGISSALLMAVYVLRADINVWLLAATLGVMALVNLFTYARLHSAWPVTETELFAQLDGEPRRPPPRASRRRTSHSAGVRVGGLKRLQGERDGLDLKLRTLQQRLERAETSARRGGGAGEGEAFGSSADEVRRLREAEKLCRRGGGARAGGCLSPPSARTRRSSRRRSSC